MAVSLEVFDSVLENGCSSAAGATGETGNRKMRTCALIAVLTLFVAAQARSNEPVRIGVWLPMTGGLGERGLAAWNGIRIAKDLWEKNGRESTTLVLADSGSNGFDSVNAMLRLLEREKVAVVIGGIGTGNITAGSSCAHTKGIAMVTSAVPIPVTPLTKQGLFGVGSDSTSHGRIGARFVREKLHAKTAAILYDISEEQSVGLAGIFRKELTRLGGTIVCEGRLKRGDRNFSGQLAGIWKTRPDIVYAPIAPIECALLARQARELGLRTPLVAGPEIQTPGFIALGGVSVEGVYSITPDEGPDRSTNDRSEFRLRYWKAFGTAPLPDATRAAEAYFMVLEAVRRAGTADPVKIREALASELQLPRLAVIQLEGSYDVRGSAFKVLRVQDGEFIRVGNQLQVDFRARTDSREGSPIQKP